MTYPSIDNPIDYAAARKAKLHTDAIMRHLHGALDSAGDAAAIDALLDNALGDFVAGLYDLMRDLQATLSERDRALAEYESDEEDVDWAPEMERGTQAGRAP